VFRVYPDALRKLTRAAERVADDAGAVGRHIEYNAKIEGPFVGVLHPLLVAHYECYEAGPATAFRLFDRYDRLSTEVDAAATMYERTDYDAASMLDAAYPHVDIPPGLRTGPSPNLTGPVPPPRAPADFADVHEPQDLLKRPVAGNRPDPQVEYNILFDLVSPMAAARWVSDWLFGFDPFEYLLSMLTGDWDALWRCGETWWQAGAATQAIATNCIVVARDLPTAWQGNAADACQMHVYQLTAAVNGLAKYYDDVAQEYFEASRIAAAEFQIICTYAQALADRVLSIAAAIGADVLSLGTLSPLVVAAVGLLAANALRLLRQLIDELDTFKRRLESVGFALAAVVGLLKRVLGLSEHSDPKLPSLPSPYDHPGA
jgi:uncharacterized protein YukE